MSAGSPDASRAQSACFQDERVPDDDLFDENVVSPMKVKMEKPDGSSGSAAGDSMCDDNLPAVEAPPEMHPGAVRAARIALKFGYIPTMCKLCVVHPKHGKNACCKSCRSKIEACKHHAKDLDRVAGVDGNPTPNLNHIESLDEMKDLAWLRMMATSSSPTLTVSREELKLVEASSARSTTSCSMRSSGRRRR